MKHFLRRAFNILVSAPLLLLLSPLLLHHFLHPDLCQSAWRALRRGDVEKAEFLAKQSLHQAKHTARNWNYGNVIHDANQILGLGALRRGDVKRAKRFLVLAGKTPGSPQLDSYGPRLALAAELVQRGEIEVVLEYLHTIHRFFFDRRPVEIARKDSPPWKRFSAVQFRFWEEKIDENGRQLYESWRKEIESGRVPQHHQWR